MDFPQPCTPDLAALQHRTPALSVEAVRSGELDEVISAWNERRKQLLFARLPDTIYLVRHGQSEGNVNPKIYHHKGDSRLELTAKGMEQAQSAGARLAALLEKEGQGHIFVGVSPFERAQQTLYGMYDGGFPRHRVSVVHHDPRLREQEFGNFQPPGLSAAVRAEIDSVGRFYYRRPNAESSADVFDRIAAFWQCLLSDGPDNLLLGRKMNFDSCVLVTHGLTIRLLLMVVCQWSVDTFETVFNIGNCHHIALSKNAEGLCYTFDETKSFPPRVPWASRRCWIVMKPLKSSEETLRQIALLRKLRASQQGKDLGKVFGAAGSGGHGRTISGRPSIVRERAGSIGSNQGHEDADGAVSDSEDGPSWPFLDRKISELEAQAMDERSRPFTVVDYLTLPCPRSMQVDEALCRCVPGHKVRGSPEELLELAKQTMLKREDVEVIDWWGPGVSPEGRRLRIRMDQKSLTAKSLDVGPGGREQAIPQRRLSRGDEVEAAEGK